MLLLDGAMKPFIELVLRSALLLSMYWLVATPLELGVAKDRPLPTKTE